MAYGKGFLEPRKLPLFGFTLPGVAAVPKQHEAEIVVAGARLARHPTPPLEVHFMQERGALALCKCVLDGLLPAPTRALEPPADAALRGESRTASGCSLSSQQRDGPAPPARRGE